MLPSSILLVWIYGLFILLPGNIAGSGNGYPSILWAAIANDKNMAAYFLNHDGNVNVTDDYGHTALTGF